MNNPQDCLIQPQRKELRLPTLYSVTAASFPIELPKGSTELASKDLSKNGAVSKNKDM